MLLNSWYSRWFLPPHYNGFEPFHSAFGVKFKEAHESRNPATGETVNVEAKYVPDFKFGSQIKNALKGVGVDAE